MGYTLDHYIKALNQFFSYYKPSYSPLIHNMNERARFQMSLNTPKLDRQRHLLTLKGLVCKVGQDLRTITNELSQITNGYYITELAGNRPQLVENMMPIGLQNFTTGQMNAVLKRAIQQL